MNHENINLNIEVEKIVVLLTNSTDRISIHTCMPTTYPNWLPSAKMVMNIECAKNYGIQYVRDNFDVKPEVINTRFLK